MQDDYATLSSGLESPATTGFAITPSDDDQLDHLPRAIYVGEGGDLVVEMQNGAELTFKDVPTGALLPIRVRKVLEDTSAGYLVGLC